MGDQCIHVIDAKLIRRQTTHSITNHDQILILHQMGEFWGVLTPDAPTVVTGRVSWFDTFAICNSYRNLCL